MENNWVDNCLEYYFNHQQNEAIGLIKKNLPGALYKYTPLRQYVVDTIAKNEIYLSSINDLNDPYECYPTIDIQEELYYSIIENKDELKKEFDIVLSDSVMQELKNATDVVDKFNELFYSIEIRKRLKFFLQDSKERITKKAFGGWNRILKNILQPNFRLQSFSERNDSPIMWSHYADKHKGICVEYDFRKFELKNPLFPVLYQDKRPLFKLDNEDLNNTVKINQVMYQVVRTKALNWRYEEEWRFLYILSKGAIIPKYIAAPVPSAIYLGSHFDSNDYKLIKALYALAKTKNIPLIKMTLHDTEYKMIPIV